MSILISPVLVAGLILFAIIQFFYYRKKMKILSRKIQEPELVQYVDTSGVDSVPPKYIDVWQGKTINFKLGKWSIIIPMVRAVDFFRYVEKIALNYETMRRMINKSSGNKWVDNILYVRLHDHNAKLIYKLSCRFVKDKRKFQKALISESRKNVAFIIGICEQVLDFWALYKKKISLLAQGATERQMGGNPSAWNSSSSDGDGKTYAMPRYALSLSTAVH